MSARALFGAPVYVEQDNVVLPNNGFGGLGAVKTCLNGDCGSARSTRPNWRGTLSGLGDDALKSVMEGSQTFIDSLTGSKATRDAQAKQMELAKLQIAAATQEAQARSETVKSVLPVALAVVGAVVALGVVGLILKKK